MTTRIPADIDQEDRILAGLTARQIVIIAVPMVLLWGFYMATRHVVPLIVFAPLAIVISGVVGTIAVLKRDGISMDRFALVAIRHRRRDRRLVPTLGETLPNIGRLHLPVTDVRLDGLIDLGPHGTAVVCSAEALDLQLQSKVEQEATTAAFGRFCNSLHTSIQFVVHTEPLQLDAEIEALRRSAASMPALGLERAARLHASFLEGLTQQRDILQRRVFVVFRDATSIDVCGDLLLQRAHEACSALRSAGIELSVLDRHEALAAIQRSCGVESQAHANGDLTVFGGQ